jgi:hypothetical protein
MPARLLRRFPDFAPAADIRALFDTQFVPDKVAADAPISPVRSPVASSSPTGVPGS